MAYNLHVYSVLTVQFDGKNHHSVKIEKTNFSNLFFSGTFHYGDLFLMTLNSTSCPYTHSAALKQYLIGTAFGQNFRTKKQRKLFVMNEMIYQYHQQLLL